MFLLLIAQKLEIKYILLIYYGAYTFHTATAEYHHTMPALHSITILRITMLHCTSNNTVLAIVYRWRNLFSYLFPVMQIFCLHFNRQLIYLLACIYSHYAVVFLRMKCNSRHVIL